MREKRQTWRNYLWVLKTCMYTTEERVGNISELEVTEKGEMLWAHYSNKKFILYETRRTFIIIKGVSLQIGSVRSMCHQYSVTLGLSTHMWCNIYLYLWDVYQKIKDKITKYLHLNLYSNNSRKYRYIGPYN